MVLYYECCGIQFEADRITLFDHLAKAHGIVITTTQAQGQTIPGRPFENVDQLCDLKYENSKDKYGESWREMSEFQLMDRFEGEREEYLAAETVEERRGEIVDMITVLRMAHERAGEMEEWDPATHIFERHVDGEHCTYTGPPPQAEEITGFMTVEEGDSDNALEPLDMDAGAGICDVEGCHIYLTKFGECILHGRRK